MPENKIAVNPLVQKLTKEKPTIAVAGYVGSGEQGRIRLYRDLSLQAYLDIPQKEVVEFIEGKTPEQRARLFFRTTATVSFAKRVRISEAISFHKSATLTADELKRTVLMFRRRPARSGCTCEGNKAGELQRQGDGGGPGGPTGPMLPPDWCEINCAQWLSICDDLPIWEKLWCYIDYLLCMWDCVSQPGDPFGGGGVIIE